MSNVVARMALVGQVIVIMPMAKDGIVMMMLMFLIIMILSMKMGSFVLVALVIFILTITLGRGTVTVRCFFRVVGVPDSLCLLMLHDKKGNACRSTAIEISIRVYSIPFDTYDFIVYVYLVALQCLDT